MLLVAESRRDYRLVNELLALQSRLNYHVSGRREHLLGSRPHGTGLVLTRRQVLSAHAFRKRMRRRYNTQALIVIVGLPGTCDESN